MISSITLDLPLPPPDANLRIGEADLPDDETASWYGQAIVNLGSLPDNWIPPGTEVAVTLKVHSDQPQDLGWLWRLLAYVVGMTVISDVRDVVRLSLQYDDAVLPGRVRVEAAATTSRAAA